MVKAATTFSAAKARQAKAASRGERDSSWCGGAGRARQQMAEGMSLPDWPELVHLDINGLTTGEAARRIVDDPRATSTRDGDDDGD